MAAIKTLTNTNRIFKKGYYMHIIISTQSNLSKHYRTAKLHFYA